MDGIFSSPLLAPFINHLAEEIRARFHATPYDVRRDYVRLAN